MHVRRAILLFAVVLGLAALVASFSQPGRAPRSDAPLRDEAESPVPTPEGDPAEVRFDAAEPGRRRVPTGAARHIVVTVGRPGDVELVGLGLMRPAEPDVPARFDVFEREPTQTEVRFTPFGGRPRSAGRLIFAEEPR